MEGEKSRREWQIRLFEQIRDSDFLGCRGKQEVSSGRVEGEGERNQRRGMMHKAFSLEVRLRKLSIHRAG